MYKLTERALENLARLIISETRKYGHKPGHQEQKEKKTPLPQKASWFSEHENTFHRSRPVYGE